MDRVIGCIACQQKWTPPEWDGSVLDGDEDNLLLTPEYLTSVVQSLEEVHCRVN